MGIVPKSVGVAGVAGETAARVVMLSPLVLGCAANFSTLEAGSDFLYSTTLHKKGNVFGDKSTHTQI
jgi:hypothetical protein